MKERIKYMIASMTYRAWHPLVIIVLAHCHRQRVITCEQWYSISAMLDRTQPRYYALKMAANHTLMRFDSGLN